VEVGPGHTLAQLARRHPEVVSGRSVPVPTLPGGAGGEDHRHAVGAVARVWTEGHEVDWPRSGSTAAAPGPVPGYPYQRTRHWVDPVPAAESRPAAEVPVPAAAPLPGRGARAGRVAVLRADLDRAAAAGRRPRRAGGRAGAAAGRGRARAAAAAGPAAGRRTPGGRPGGRRLPGGRAGVPGPARVRRRPGPGAGRPGPSGASGRAPGARADRRPAGAADHPYRGRPAGRRLPQPVRARAGGRPAARGRPAAGGPRRHLRVGRRHRGEPVEPVKAVLHGFLRSLVRESPRLHCRLVDVGPGAGEADLGRRAGPLGQPRRGRAARRRRWVRREQPWERRPG
jgi:hypothetical protein